MNTTRFKNLIMGNIFGTQKTVAIPTNYYIGLSSTEPTVSGTNVTEPSTSSTGYSRVRLSSLSAPDNGVITNSQEIRFNESLTDWFPAGKPATHYVIFDSQTNGNLLMYNSLTKSRIIESNTVATITPSSLQLKLLD